MSSREFVEWRAFNALEPPEPVRGDYRTALLAFVVCKLFAGEKYRGKIEDFLLEFRRADAAAEDSAEPDEIEMGRRSEMNLMAMFGLTNKKEKGDGH